LAIEKKKLFKFSKNGDEKKNKCRLAALYLNNLCSIKKVSLLFQKLTKGNSEI